MGWSCTRDASETLDDIFRYCISVSQTQNVFNDKGDFIEPSRVEHHDGAITGSIYTAQGHKRGSFRINPNGSVSRPNYIEICAEKGRKLRRSSV